MERIKKLTIDYDFDLLCLTELNKDWRSVAQQNTIWNGAAGACNFSTWMSVITLLPVLASLLCA